MRNVKAILLVLLFAGAVVCSVQIYLQSPGAGISMGLLSALVLISLVFDSRHGLFGQESLAEEEVAAGSMAVQRKIAMRHARSLSAQEDGDIPALRRH